jgi:hypothetical protein
MSCISAARKEGFKTANLREAAREAGIAPEFMQHALMERGLVAPATLASENEPVIIDLTEPARFFWGEPLQICYECVLEGELHERDFDVMVDTIRRRAGDWGDAGLLSTVGRSLTWSTHSKAGRRMQVSIFPRNGKTTIRVLESLKESAGGIYGGIIGGFGGGLGGIAFAIFQKARGFGLGLTHDERMIYGLATWFCLAGLSALSARIIADRFSTTRQKSLQAMIRELANRAKDSIDFDRR